ncbi:hypothetical protein GWI33_006222 [Rhynchophorus ferrugineus]|uniref:Uncharacterized protein n=1 Tax=Rhynchophorus ferrugineus TaxID=354439 RepID=A0A834IJ54_RHYFE|nr:hypothetical protein GWI33_006222 [Rhynchophorus ferrugineus]
MPLLLEDAVCSVKYRWFNIQEYSACATVYNESTGCLSSVYVTASLIEYVLSLFEDVSSIGNTSKTVLIVFRI